MLILKLLFFSCYLLTDTRTPPIKIISQVTESQVAIVNGISKLNRTFNEEIVKYGPNSKIDTNNKIMIIILCSDKFLNSIKLIITKFFAIKGRFYRVVIKLSKNIKRTLIFFIILN